MIYYHIYVIFISFSSLLSKDLLLHLFFMFVLYLQIFLVLFSCKLDSKASIGPDLGPPL